MVYRRADRGIEVLGPGQRTECTGEGCITHVRIVEMQPGTELASCPKAVECSEASFADKLFAASTVLAEPVEILSCAIFLGPPDSATYSAHEIPLPSSQSRVGKKRDSSSVEKKEPRAKKIPETQESREISGPVDDDPGEALGILSTAFDEAMLKIPQSLLASLFTDPSNLLGQDLKSLPDASDSTACVPNSSETERNPVQDYRDTRTPATGERSENAVANRTKEPRRRGKAAKNRHSVESAQINKNARSSMSGSELRIQLLPEVSTATIPPPSWSSMSRGEMRHEHDRSSWSPRLWPIQVPCL